MSKHGSKLLISERMISFVDLSRTLRELENLDDVLNQASLRSGGDKVQLPRTTQMLEDTATINKLSLLNKDHRQSLISALRSFKIDPPLIHMSFTVEPSAAFVERMILWLRANIREDILLDIGMQPTIVAGCVVRTKNKVFDMSLSNNLYEKREILVNYLGGSIE